jgi:hypothetical protein
MKSVIHNISLQALILMIIVASSCRGGGTGTAEAGIQDDDSTSVPEITFNTLVHDFGVLTEGEKVAYVFTFTNSGSGSLVINSATTSCGCTVPQYSRKPVLPGGKGTLEVVFNTSGYKGMQTKTITVQSNAMTPVIVLAIKADIKSEN